MLKNNMKLRFVEKRDLPFVQKYCSYKEVAESTTIPHPYPDGGAEAWFKQVIKDKNLGRIHTFAIIYKMEFTGVVSVKNMGNSKGAIGYWLAPQYWNKGIATQAVSEAIHFSFNELDLKQIESFCLSSNIGSKKVLEKNGFILFKKETLETKKHKGEEFSFYRLEKRIQKLN